MLADKSGLASAVPLPLEGFPILALNFVEHMTISMFESTAEHGLNARIVDNLHCVASLSFAKARYIVQVFDRLLRDGPVALPCRADVDAWRDVLSPLLPVLDPDNALNGGLAVLPNTMGMILYGKVYVSAYRSAKPRNLPDSLIPPRTATLPMSLRYQVRQRQRLVASTSNNSPTRQLEHLVAKVRDAVGQIPAPPRFTRRALEQLVLQAEGVRDVAVVQGDQNVVLVHIRQGYDAPSAVLSVIQKLTSVTQAAAAVYLVTRDACSLPRRQLPAF